MTIYPVPKPPVKAKPARTPRKRPRVKSRNAKRKGSSFPRQRDKKYTTWLVTEHPCMLLGREMAQSISANDHHHMVYDKFGPKALIYVHVCWSGGDRFPIDPAHVGEHRSKGAPDFGATVPMCHAAHAFYDHHRDEWKRVTGYSERKMASAASGYALKYVEQGGISAPPP